VYSVVLLAAMTGGGQAAGWGHPGGDCGNGPGCAPPLGGVVIFFWMGPSCLSEAEEAAWQEYLMALDEPDRSDAIALWCQADRCGKQLFLGQISAMRPKKPEEEEDKEKKAIEEKKLDAEGKKIEKDKDKKIEAPGDKKIEKDKGAWLPSGRRPAPATLVVSLPAGAKLTVEGHRTGSTGAVRELRSPALEPGKTYRYALVAELERQGRTIVVRRAVEVRAGALVRVTMEPAPAPTARR